MLRSAPVFSPRLRVGRCRARFSGGARAFKRFFGAVVVSCGWLLATGPLQAHHSLAGVYDLHKESEASGSLTKIPVHESPRVAASRSQAPGRLDHRVSDDARLRDEPRAARDREDGPECDPCRGNAGDNITVKFIPAKNGSPLGFVKSVTLPDGRVIQISAGNPND